MRTRRFTRKLQRLQPLALASLLALGASGLNAAPRSFVGPGSFWDVVANWTGGLLPGVGDDVLLGGFDTTVRSNFSINSFSGTGTLSLTGGTLSIAASSVTGNFVQTSGVLAGAGDLLITGSASFSGGGMVGPGQTRVDGLLTMGNFAGFALDEGRSLLINGGAVFSNNSINLNPGNTGNAAAGRIVNAAGSTITDNSSSGTHIFTQNFGAPDNGASASFTNAGSYNKTGSGTSTIGANFINSGSVNVGAGSLVLSGGGTHTGASFSGAGTLNFGGGVHTLDATSSLAVQQLGVSSGTLNLAGSVNVGSSTTVNGGTLNLTAPVASLGTALNISGGLANLGSQNLTVASFSQSGGGLTGSGQFTVTGTSTWGGGSMAGSGETHFNGALALGNFAGMNLDEGRTVFIHAGATLSNNGINLNPGNTGNAAAGRIVNAAGSTITDNSSSGSSIFTQNFGAPDNGASASFSNLGTYTKTGTGTSTLNANFLNGGTVNVDGGGLALTGNSTHTGATLTGTGTLSFSGGVHSLDAASVISTQNLSFTGGTTTVAGIYNVAGTSTFSGGVVNLPAVITSLGQNLVINGGTANLGSNSATVVNFTQSGGVLAGSGNLTVSGAVTLSGGQMLGSGQTVLNAPLAMNNFAGLGLDEGRTLLIAGGATFGNNSFNLNPGNTGNAAAGRIVNAAGSTITDNSSSGTSIFTQNFGGADNGASASFTNRGTYTKTGAGTSNIAALALNSGTVNIDGGGLLFSGGSSHTGATLAGAGTLSFSGGVHDVDAASTISTSQVTVGGGSVTLAGSYDVAGTTTVNGGSVAWVAPITRLGAALVIGGGEANLGSNDASVNSYTQTGGVLRGSGRLTVPGGGTVVLGGGQMVGSGETLFNTTASFNNFAGIGLDEGRTLVFAGNASLSNNSINLNPGNSGNAAAGRIVNAAGSTLTDSSTSGSSIFTQNFGGADNGASASFSNLGTYTKTGAGSSNFNVSFTNSGTLNVNAGSLVLQTGSTQDGQLNIAAGATLNFAAGTHALNNAANLANQGTLRLSGGELNVNGALNAAGLLVLAGGSFNGGAGTHQTASFNQSAGSLNGTGDFIVSGNTTLSGGGMVGSGRTVLNGALAMATNSGIGLDEGRTLVIQGGASFSNNSINLNPGNTGNTAAGRLVNTAGSGITDDSNSGSHIFTQNFGGLDNGASASFSNAGSYTKAGAGTTTFNVNLLNSGTLNANAGTLVLGRGLSGTGTLATAGAGTVRLDANGDVGTLLNHGNAVNALNLQGFSITVSGDYDNTNFGSGNSFNRRANVATSGTGPRILAAGDVSQALAGAQVAGGATAAPTLSFGNVHVGSTTLVYQIVNVGSSGPALRGALQTAVNGAHVSDARLSGSGVTAGNWGALAAGAALPQEVSLTVATAGVYAPLAGQAVNVLNNFENTRSQLLTINSSAGAAAYHLATAASVTPNPVQLANQRVGMALSGALTVANTAPAGSFTEGLNASFGNFSGHAAGNGGSVQLLAAGSSNHTAMALLLDTSTAGAKSGTAQLLFTSDGSGSSGLGLTALGTQTVAISGDVYRLASAGLATPSPVVLLDQRVGGTLTQALNLSNTAPADGYSEGLNASISASGSATAAGAFSLLAAGGSSSALHVGVDTGSAGAKSGQALITLASDGSGTSGFGALALGTQTVNVSGNVYRLAVPVVDTTPLRLVGRVGDATLQAQIAVSNNAPDLFTERLNASIASAPAGTNAGPALLGLLPNASGQLALSLPTGTAGSFSGAVGVALVSSSAGTTSGAPDASLGTVNVGLDARIYAPAVAQLPVTVVNFGTVRVGDTVAARNVAVGNSASGALTDTLHASISGGGAPFSSSGSVVGLAAGASNSSALMVQLATATAGVFNSAATVQLRSQNPDLPDLALASMNVQLQGQVNHIASATLAQAGGGGTFSGTAFSYTLDFGTLLLDGGTVTSTLSLANAATGTADALAGSWNLATLAGGPFSAAGFEAFTGLAAGSQLGGLTVSFSSSTEGSFNRTVVLNGLSTNGSGPDLALNPITLQLQGTVVAVPEPGTYLMMTVGVLMMGSIARRKLRAQQPG